jgi:hypothetical protein
MAPRFRSTLMITLILLPFSARAGDKPPVRSPLFEQVVDCRHESDATKRLACYDRSVDAMNAAADAHQIAVVDQAQVHEARRSLFGLTLPRLSLFDGDDGDKQDIDQIQSTITSTTYDQDNRLIFTIEGGARWHQIDDRPSFQARRGAKVTIKKAALGSFFADFARGAGIRVRRDN